jgi:2'-5' RNA ligase
MSRENWFFAFPVPGAFVTALPELPAAFRRFHPDDVHLTLAFLGCCGPQRAERALGALDEQLARALPEAIEIALAEVVAMGPRRSYSALSALLGTGREQTQACMASLRDPLTEAASGRRDQREPKPHVTLARPRRRATDAQRAAGLAWAEALRLDNVRARLDRIALYRWDELRRERLFRIVAERPLRA